MTVRSNRLARDARARLANVMFEQFDAPGVDPGQVVVLTVLHTARDRKLWPGARSKAR